MWAEKKEGGKVFFRQGELQFQMSVSFLQYFSIFTHHCNTSDSEEPEPSELNFPRYFQLGPIAIKIHFARTGADISLLPGKAKWVGDTQCDDGVGGEVQ